MFTIDGHSGGGQILRSALTLSLATGDPFRIHDIRASRRKPGLRRQHLTAVGAAVQVGGAEVIGAELNSSEITFRPGAVKAGRYDFHISTAGSTTLVLQTVLPVLLTADRPSHVALRGGTHNPLCPPYDFLERTFLPLVQRLGPQCSSSLQRHGFFPAGGGAFTVDIEPVAKLAPLDLTQPVSVQQVRARVLVSRLPKGIGQRQQSLLERSLDIPREHVELVHIEDCAGPGNMVLVDVLTDAGIAVFSSIGRRRLSSERVIEDVTAQVRRFVEGGVAVGLHLADQLLLPLALGSGGTFRTLAPVDDHTTSHADLIQRWLSVPVRVEAESDTVARVTVG